MSAENIQNITKSDKNFAPTSIDQYILADINFDRHWLINTISIPKKVIHLYISYMLNPQLKNSDFTLDNCLFEFVKVTKNSDPDKYKYNGYGIGYYSRSDFSFTG